MTQGIWNPVPGSRTYGCHSVTLVLEFQDSQPLTASQTRAIPTPPHPLPTSLFLTSPPKESVCPAVREARAAPHTLHSPSTHWLTCSSHPVNVYGWNGELSLRGPRVEGGRTHPSPRSNQLCVLGEKSVCFSEPRLLMCTTGGRRSPRADDPSAQGPMDGALGPGNCWCLCP